MRQPETRLSTPSTLALWLALLTLLITPLAALAEDTTIEVDESPGWIIKLRDGWAGPSGQVTLESVTGDATLEALPGLPRTYVARFDGSTTASTAIARLVRNPAVEYIEPDFILTYQIEPNDPLVMHQSWIKTIKLPDAWDITGGVPEVVIAVIDSGVRSDHPDLVDRLVPGYNFIHSNTDTTDIVGHGTSVAGVAAAAGNNGAGGSGAALDVRIMPLRVGTADGSPISRIVAAIDFAVVEGADVINLSLGAPNESATLQDAIRRAHQNNIPVVSASGNMSNEVTFPASYPEAISVGATVLDGSALADFTSRISRVDLVAPGVDVLTPYWSAADGNTYAWRTGTSFAAPMVAGTIALMLSVEPTLTVEEIRQILTSTTQSTVPAGEPGVGAGLLDAGAVVRRTLLPRFGATWLPSDEPVSNLIDERTWTWGPHAFFVGIEPYSDAEHGSRLVAYFDKSRMEITDPLGDPSSVWHVTNGLLVNEMIGGDVQLGDSMFEHIGPANIPVAGDPDDETGPYYASFKDLRATPALEQGSLVTQTIARDGTVGDDQRFAGYGVTANELTPDTGHRVASVFWSYLNSTGTINDGNGEYMTALIFDPPFYATGYPVTGAYWARVTVAGVEQDVLVQCFERRCLTYTPSNPPGWQVEMGNVGQHYYRWRYGETSWEPAGENPSALALAGIH